ncbi:MAG: site-specific integrase, partial [Nitrospinae bacterium]|nr:site-specific integrase [Nitrospinota bacterium]
CRDIDITHELMHIKDQKSGESRVAYIIPILKKMLQQRLKNRKKKDGYLFLTRKGKKVKEISNVFDRSVNRLKLNENVTDPRDRIVAHSLRHSFASWLIMDGVPLATVQKLMGHRSITMTLRYSHLAPSHEREAVHRLAETQRKVVPIIKKRKQK